MNEGMKKSRSREKEKRNAKRIETVKRTCEEEVKEL